MAYFTFAFILKADGLSGAYGGTCWFTVAFWRNPYIRAYRRGHAVLVASFRAVYTYYVTTDPFFLVHAASMSGHRLGTHGARIWQSSEIFRLLAISIFLASMRLGASMAGRPEAKTMRLLGAPGFKWRFPFPPYRPTLRFRSGSAPSHFGAPGAETQSARAPPPGDIRILWDGRATFSFLDLPPGSYAAMARCHVRHAARSSDSVISRSTLSIRGYADFTFRNPPTASVVSVTGLRPRRRQVETLRSHHVPRSYG